MSARFQTSWSSAKHIRNIAWETEVWLCDFPDHMIHYDGERFLGPKPVE